MGHFYTELWIPGSGLTHPGLLWAFGKWGEKKNQNWSCFHLFWWQCFFKKTVAIVKAAVDSVSQIRAAIREVLKHVFLFSSMGQSQHLPHVLKVSSGFRIAFSNLALPFCSILSLSICARMCVCMCVCWWVSITKGKTKYPSSDISTTGRPGRGNFLSLVAWSALWWENSNSHHRCEPRWSALYWVLSIQWVFTKY